MPELIEEGFWPAQIIAVKNLDFTARVCICTIQRLYSMLKGEDLSEEDEEQIEVNQGLYIFIYLPF